MEKGSEDSLAIKSPSTRDSPSFIVDNQEAPIIRRSDLSEITIQCAIVVSDECEEAETII